MREGLRRESVRQIFATSLASLVYEILPARPGKLLNKLNITESRQLLGACVFEGKERRIETTDEVDRTSRDAFRVDRGGPLKREVFEDRPEYRVAEDMGMAQIGAAAGNRRSRHLQFFLSRVSVPDFDVGKDLTLFFDAPDIDVLHDVAPKSENGGSMP